MLLGKKIGPFAIEKELGSGAMGIVYKALYTKTGQPVAIKVILQGLNNNENMLARFEREIGVLKQLHHPNIVRLLASGRYKNSPFYAMEFLEGEPLDKILKRRERLPWQEVIALGKQLCAALQHAHENEIIHRDLKPANLIITPEGVVKLTDFGIAKDLDVTGLTATNSTVGTASYMSPEQCQGVKFLTNKSDLYSLGVLLYEMLTGRHPFHADTLMEMFLQHVQGDYVRPGRLIMEIPLWLDNVVCQLLAKKPEDRPFDANRVAYMLDQVVEKAAQKQGVSDNTAAPRALDRPPSTKTGKKNRSTRSLFGTKSKQADGPFHEQIWFQATAISALLAVVVFLIYQGLKPPDPGKLYREAETLMKSSNPEHHDKAREGPIKAYLAQKKDADDEQSKQIWAWADMIDLDTKERAQRNRFKRISQPDGEEEQQAWSAMRAEEAGDWSKAKTRWQDLLPFRSYTDTDKRAWGLLAERHLELLRDAERRYNAFNAQIEAASADKSKVKPEDDVDDSVAEALTQEAAGNKPAAREAWKRVKDVYDKNRDQYVWVLLAARKMKDLPAKDN